VNGEYRSIQVLNAAHGKQPDRSWRNVRMAYRSARQAAIDLKTALYTTIITLHFNSSGASRFRRA
jgi:hypothetical protein